MRKFGIEIECFGPVSSEAVARAISAAGVNCVAEGYNHLTRSYWKVITDGSIQAPGSQIGYEIVSPPLTGEAYDDIRTVSNVLIDLGVTVNRSCGLHVHIDAANLTTPQLFMVAARYHRFGNEIDAVLPNSRRATNNMYCLPLTDEMAAMRDSTTPERVFGMPSRSMVQQFFERGSMRSRYRKLNLMSYLVHGTVEFRQHSGTVEARKIINWVEFCQNFVEQSIAVASQVTSTVVQQNDNRAVDPHSGLAASIYYFLCRRGHASNGIRKVLTSLINGWTGNANELAAHIGITRQTLSVYVSHARGFLRRNNVAATIAFKNGRYTLVHTNTTSTSLPAFPTTWDFLDQDLGSAFDGLPTATRNYFVERQQELAS